jgi:hypothetical protein
MKVEKEGRNSRLFTVSDLQTARIENAIYDEHSERWDITVRHNDISYIVLTYELGHPDDEISKDQIAFIVEKVMLTMENESVPKVEVKRKFEVDISSIANVNLGDLNKSEPKPLDRSRYLVHDKIGDESFFTESEVLEKGHIHIILDKNKMSWNFGRYNQDSEWLKGDRVVRVNGKRIRLYDYGNWEYMEELPQENILVLNQRITFDIFPGASKYIVHMIFNMDQLTWEYGPDNEDDGWLGEGKTINYQSYTIKIGNNGRFELER